MEINNINRTEESIEKNEHLKVEQKIVETKVEPQKPTNRKINLCGKGYIFTLKALNDKVGIRIVLSRDEQDINSEFIFSRVDIASKEEVEILRQPFAKIEYTRFKSALKIAFGLDDNKNEKLLETIKGIITEPINYPKDLVISVEPIFTRNGSITILKIAIGRNEYEVSSYNKPPKNDDVIRDILSFIAVESERAKFKGDRGLKCDQTQLEVDVKRELAKYKDEYKTKKGQTQLQQPPSQNTFNHDVIRGQIEADLKASQLNPVKFDDGRIVIYDGQKYRFSLEKGLEEIMMVKNQNGVETQLIQINRAPIFISKRLVNSDNGNIMYELSYKMFDEFKTVMVSQREMTSRELHKKIGDKYKFHEADAKALSDYLNHLDEVNDTDIPTIKLYSKMGWKEHYTGFVIGRKKYGVEPSQDEDVEFLSFDDSGDKYIEALTPKGTIEGWLKATHLLLRHYPVRMVCYVVSASFLLELLDESSSIHNQAGTSSIGKSLMNAVGMSIVGHPEILELQADATKIFVERMLNAYNNIPINLDEVQLMDKDELKKIIYMVGNNTSRGRGKKDGGVQEQSNWRTNVLSSGEAPLTNDESFIGAKVRGRDYYGGIGERDEEGVRTFDEGMRENYGVIAIPLIRKIMKEKETLKERYKNCFNEISKSLSVKDNNIVDRMADSYASVLLGGYIFEDVMKEVGGEVKNPLEVVLPIIEEIIVRTATETYCFKAIQAIYSWIDENKDHFLINGSSPCEYPPHQTYGGLFNDTTIDIYIGSLKQMLTKVGFNYSMVIREFEREKIILDTRSGEKGYYNSREDRVIAINTNAVNEKFRLTNPLMSFPAVEYMNRVASMSV